MSVLGGRGSRDDVPEEHDPAVADSREDAVYVGSRRTPEKGRVTVAVGNESSGEWVRLDGIEAEPLDEKR